MALKFINQPVWAISAIAKYSSDHQIAIYSTKELAQEQDCNRPYITW